MFFDLITGDIFDKKFSNPYTNPYAKYDFEYGILSFSNGSFVYSMHCAANKLDPVIKMVRSAQIRTPSGKAEIFVTNGSVNPNRVGNHYFTFQIEQDMVVKLATWMTCLEYIDKMLAEDKKKIRSLT